MTKRIYEKPVYIAQTYVTASSIAAGCQAKPGSIEGTTQALSLSWNMSICAYGDNGHRLGGGTIGEGENKAKYWDNYAIKDESANLFDTTNVACDFIWKGSTVSGWTTGTNSTTLQSDSGLRNTNWIMQLGADFMGFFAGTGQGSNNKNHTPGYGGKVLLYS